MNLLIDIGLYFAYGLIIIAALGSTILPLINSLSDPGSLLKTGAGVIALVLLFVLAYVIAGNEVTPLYATHGVDATQSKWVGAALITMYVLFILAIVSILVTEVSKFFK